MSFLEIFNKFHKQLEEGGDDLNLRDERGVNLNHEEKQPQKKSCC